jgi:hypothetical protein
MFSNSSTAREGNLENNVDGKADNRMNIQITTIFSDRTKFPIRDSLKDAPPQYSDARRTLAMSVLSGDFLMVENRCATPRQAR